TLPSVPTIHSGRKFQGPVLADLLLVSLLTCRNVLVRKEGLIPRASTRSIPAFPPNCPPMTMRLAQSQPGGSVAMKVLWVGGLGLSLPRHANAGHAEEATRPAVTPKPVAIAASSPGRAATLGRPMPAATLAAPQPVGKPVATLALPMPAAPKASPDILD